MRDNKRISAGPSKRFSILVFCLAFYILSGFAYAHKVYVFAWVEAGKIYTESYFSGNKKVKNGQIEVFDSSGQKLLEGKTDEQGLFSFLPPGKEDLRIILNAGMGHRAEYLLGAEQIPKSAVRKSEPAKEKGDLDVSTEQIREVVDQALKERLKPIERRLAAMEKERGPGITEVLGGIGYIIGLMGIVLYFKSRRARS